MMSLHLCVETHLGEIKIILTGATGLVGEGVLPAWLEQPLVKEVLMVNRKSNALKHPRIKECIIPSFLNPDEFSEQLSGYDACFYCAGISSNGMNKSDYSHITYDTTLHSSLVKVADAGSGQYDA